MIYHSPSTPIRSTIMARQRLLKIQQPATRIDNSFFPSAIKLWNSLPANVIDSAHLMTLNVN